MGQRIMIAMMLILEPDLIIADERPRRSTSPSASGADHPRRPCQPNAAPDDCSSAMTSNLVAEFCDRVLSCMRADPEVFRRGS